MIGAPTGDNSKNRRAVLWKKILHNNICKKTIEHSVEIGNEAGQTGNRKGRRRIGASSKRTLVNPRPRLPNHVTSARIYLYFLTFQPGELFEWIFRGRNASLTTRYRNISVKTCRKSFYTKRSSNRHAVKTNINSTDISMLNRISGSTRDIPRLDGETTHTNNRY